MEVPTAHHDKVQDGDWLFAFPAFYAEFAPLRQHSNVVDHLYVMKDCGIMTADQRAFASPFMEIAFTFRNSSQAPDSVPRVVVVEPCFGHRKKSRAFHGWAFGIRTRPSACRPPATDLPPFTGCQSSLAQALHDKSSCSDILDILDRFWRELALQAADRPGAVEHVLGAPHTDVTGLATRFGQSTRTLQRRIKTSTGLPPKRFQSVERFRRAVQEVPVRNAKLSAVAGDLGFSDQAHLTREFQRHAGLSPGAFQRAWGGFRGQAVRFVQDLRSPTRLRVAVWAPEDRG
ncbi:MAG: helix-turn-helix domain-containing protein [Planctomycetota bacterium]